MNTPLTVASCSGISAIADLNRDGRPDPLSGNSILLNEGDGTFHKPPGTLADNPVPVADRSVNVLFRSGTAALAVVLDRGDGPFGPALAA